MVRNKGFTIQFRWIFKKFKDPKIGGFKESLKSDTRGLLSLYEAAYVRIHSDEILEEAVSFTTTYLKSFKEKPTCHILLKEVEHALIQPLQRSIPRLEARHYISIYEELDSKNETLLKLAKLDFNLLQMLHKQELRDLSRWWKKLDIISKLGYPRDRLVECYYWALGAFYEPQYNVARILITKNLALVSVIDDTYDAYGTIEELQVFTDAVQKWNIEEIDQLPDYMKICYIALLDLFDGFEKGLKEDDRSYAVNTTKEQMKQLIQGYFIEAKWFIKGDSPPFSEYLRIGLITSTYYLLTPVCYLGMKAATEEVFSWLSQSPKIVRLCAIISRFVDDLSTYQIEKRRGQITTPIDCYMKDFGVTEDEAILKLKEMVEDGWKEISEECIKPTCMPWRILAPIVNLARVIDLVYKYDEDGYTYPERVLKYHTISLVIDPIKI
ncbi:hypothetical protein LIER_20044 [Lithospermum erythrorhizon]|uniref:Sesquiterpene synthase n=1 Tax=Lithospermum erythrorhizon TaxID=34254 RepID=A0AAV3QL45_LITER